MITQWLNRKTENPQLSNNPNPRTSPVNKTLKTKLRTIKARGNFFDRIMPTHYLLNIIFVAAFGQLRSGKPVCLKELKMIHPTP